MIEAGIVLDSVSREGKRLTTFKLRYPKFVHGEFMTHRVLSRNASSSRAVPTAKLIEEVRSDALRAAPVFWGKNQKGMRAAEELADKSHCEGGEDVGLHARYIDVNPYHDPLCFVPPKHAAKFLWKAAAIRAADCAEQMARVGAHKQIVNRLLEPFSHINVVATATEWENFFGLRLHADAQPEMRALAEAMWAAREASAPRGLEPGEWHLPFFDWDETRHPDGSTRWDMSTGAAEETALKVSVARCARVSYESFETGKRSTVDEDLKLCERLLGAAPIHASPAEHQATPDEMTPSRLSGSAGGGGPFVWRNPEQHGNFVGWRQYRKMIAGEAVAPLPAPRGGTNP